MGYTRQLKTNKTAEEATKPSKGTSFGIVDNRVTAAIHQSLQDAATASTQTVQLKGPLDPNNNTKKRKRAPNDDNYIADDELTDKEIKKPEEKKRKLNEEEIPQEVASQAAVLPDAAEQEDTVAKPRDGLSRAKRLRGRRGTVNKDLPPLGKARPVGTSFGPAKISQQPFSKKDPQITTNRDDYGGAKHFPDRYGSEYTDWTSSLKPEHWKEISENMKSRTVSEHKGFSKKQLRGSASITATTQEAEIYRDPMADKIARSAAEKMAVDGNTKPYASYFGMAAKGGAHYYKGITDGTRTPTPEDLAVFEGMSDSSD